MASGQKILNFGLTYGWINWKYADLKLTASHSDAFGTLDLRLIDGRKCFGLERSTSLIEKELCAEASTWRAASSNAFGTLADECLIFAIHVDFSSYLWEAIKNKMEGEN